MLQWTGRADGCGSTTHSTRRGPDARGMAAQIRSQLGTPVSGMSGSGSCNTRQFPAGAGRVRRPLLHRPRRHRRGQGAAAFERGVLPGAGGTDREGGQRRGRRSGRSDDADGSGVEGDRRGTRQVGDPRRAASAPCCTERVPLGVSRPAAPKGDPHTRRGHRRGAAVRQANPRNGRAACGNGAWPEKGGPGARRDALVDDHRSRPAGRSTGSSSPSTRQSRATNRSWLRRSTTSRGYRAGRRSSARTSRRARHTSTA